MKYWIYLMFTGSKELILWPGNSPQGYKNVKAAKAAPLTTGLMAAVIGWPEHLDAPYKLTYQQEAGA